MNVNGHVRLMIRIRDGNGEWMLGLVSYRLDVWIPGISLCSLVQAKQLRCCGAHLFII